MTETTSSTSTSSTNELSKAERLKLIKQYSQGINFALEKIPYGNQIDLALQILEEHHPFSPQIEIGKPDRGDIMLWCAGQSSEDLGVYLEELIIALGQRQISQMTCKRLLKLAYEGLTPDNKSAFVEWAK